MQQQRDVRLDQFSPTNPPYPVTCDPLPTCGATLFCAAPKTGRTHQIRLHLASLGNPILGDELYGQQCPPLLPRMALHAASLSLRHPVTKQPLLLTAPLAEDIAQALGTLGMEVEDLAAEIAQLKPVAE